MTSQQDLTSNVIELRYGLILWDFDGTLCDTFGAIEVSMCAAGVNCPGDLSFIMGVFRSGATLVEGVVNLIARARGVNCTAVTPSDPHVTELVEGYLTNYVKLGRAHEKLFPEAHSTLAALASFGAEQVVISNKRQQEVSHAVGRHGIDHFFTKIVGFQPNKPTKPDPAMFTENLAPHQLKVERSRILMVGDTAADIAFGDNIGADTVLVGNKTLSKSTSATFVVDRLSEIVSIVYPAYSGT